jgi:hypothetical protein
MDLPPDSDCEDMIEPAELPPLDFTSANDEGLLGFSRENAPGG